MMPIVTTLFLLPVAKGLGIRVKGLGKRGIRVVKG